MAKECEMCQEFKSYCSSLHPMLKLWTCDACFECLSQDNKKLEQQNKALRELVGELIQINACNISEMYTAQDTAYQKLKELEVK
jgi:hypothetical protein